MIQITSETKNQTFQLRDGWHLIFNGRVPPTEWQERGPAEAQLQLLESGYSILTPEGNIKHVGAEPRPVTLRRLVARLADQYSKTEDEQLCSWYYSAFLLADSLERSTEVRP